MTDPLRLEVVEEPLPAELTADLRNGILANPVVRTRWPNSDLWFVGLDSFDKTGPEDEPYFRAVLADMGGSDVVDAVGSLWDLGSVIVVPTGRARVPHEEERAWAVEVLRRDREWARRIDAGEVELYRPMPPLASTLDANGSFDRAVAVGVRETGPDGTVRHRLIGVRSADGEVFEAGLPLEGEAGVVDGPDAAAAAVTGAGAPQARVRVWRGGELLWDLVVVRPSSSSGVNGSGVELRNVDYQGVRVLQRAHTPIVAVAYDDGAAARTWLSEESPFDAAGTEPVPGYLVADSVPQTILDQGKGGGGFRGVALWLDGEELAIVSQVEAGWHRYVSEWRLLADGTIRPRMGFAAVRNPRTGAAHTHHAYFRLDFDVVTADQNQLQEHNDPTLPGQLARWHTIRYETCRRRAADHQRQWRVKTVRAPHGYAIVPGPDDGTADAFGAGDLWVLAYHADELDDGEGVTTDPARARPQLDRLVSGELVEREDIVVWYGVHVEGETGVRAGPDLAPFNWRAKVERAPYEVLTPPVVPEPEDEDDDEDEDEDGEGGGE